MSSLSMGSSLSVSSRVTTALIAMAMALTGPALAVVPANASALRSNAPGWSPKTPELSTSWTNQVGPNNALPDYPRPQLTRDDWQNLNGIWQFAGASFGTNPPIGKDLPEQILVPYPVESALSGIKRHESSMWYRRTFTVPASWQGQHFMLNFGAVNYQTTVYVNGHQVGTHQGGYDSFSFDITNALNPSGNQEIVVGATNNGENSGQPVGKQRVHSTTNIFYTASSGIWQTVWLEPTPAAHITALDEIPDLGASALRLTVHTADGSGQRVQAEVTENGLPVAEGTGQADQQFSLHINNPHLWSPSDPFLYDLKVTLESPGDARSVDTVGSYFGMRSISIGKGADGKPRMMLNGQFVFQLGTLDQGFWPDGIYTAPTDDALRYDLQQQKNLGFNAVRKHIKVEPERWYYWADKLGMMVWQDMPAMNINTDSAAIPSQPRPSAAAQQEFRNELHTMITQHISHPSIVLWVPFNEGWGEFDQGNIANQVKSWDSSRLVNANSGQNCCYSGADPGGDFFDDHTYVGPGAPGQDNSRAIVDGEFGGLGLRIAGHEWQSGRGTSYEMEPDSSTLTNRYVQLLDKVRDLAANHGLSAAIYTQATDVENEVNGLFTYDRQLKLDANRVQQANDAVLSAAH